jgi:hypothetical protein
MNMLPTVYVASAYSLGDPVINTRNAILAAEEVCHVCVPIIPHLNLMWDMLCPHEPKFWYDYTLRLMCICDIVWRLPGISVGADNEVKVALEKGIPVVYSKEQLFTLLKTTQWKAHYENI